MIKVSYKEGNNCVIYIVKWVFDLILVFLLDEKKINYFGFSEFNFFMDMLGWFMFILVILGLWMFMVNCM